VSTRLGLLSLLVSSLLLCGACRAAPTPTPQPTRVASTITSTPSLAPPPPAATATAVPTTTPLPTPTVFASPTPGPRIVLTAVGAQGAAAGMLHVAGRAQVFEAVVSLRVITTDGRIAARGVTMAEIGAPEWGDFSVDIVYLPPDQDQPAVLEVYEESPRDGSPESLVSAPVLLRAAPELAGWPTYRNPMFAFEVRYPADWYVNQGAFAPAAPITTRFSTYREGSVSVLGPRDAEAWISASDSPSLAEMEDLEAKGYVKRRLIISGVPAVRYTDRAPHHGMYDVVYTLLGEHEYRIHLSAATHDFDAVFNLMLATFLE
jgi:hypothetical protein